MVNRLIAGGFLVALGLAANAAQIVSQRCLVANFAGIWPSPMTAVLDRDEASRESQDVGDTSLMCESEASFQEVRLVARSELLFHGTNTLANGQWWIECSFSMQSHGDVLTVDTNLITKSFAWTTASLQIQSDTPFRYDIATEDQSPGSLPIRGVISIRTASGHPVLELDWDSTTGSLPQSHGRLAPGVYQVEFFSAVDAEGDIGPTMLNPIAGAAQAATSLTVTAEQPSANVLASLHIRQLGDGHVLLDMTALEPGTMYFIERNEKLTPEAWPIVANFTAGGTNAVWTDSVQSSAQSVFYRLRH
jgi:hypothetical protein